MSNLPEGWVLSRLDELLADEPRAMTDGPFGSNLKSSHYTEAGPRVIRLQNIGDGVFVDEKAHISPDHFSSLQTHSVHEGDLVVASLGQELPRACIVPSHVPPAIVKADCIRVRLRPDIDPKYVNYALQRPSLRHEVADQVHGVGRPRLGMAGIRALTVPLAPSGERDQIVAAIEKHLSDLDAATRAVSTAATRLQPLRARLLNLLWTGHEVPVSDLLAVPLANGRSVPTRPGGFPVLRLTALKRRRIDLDERKNGDWDEQAARPFLVEQGDFLVSRGNGSLSLVGRGGLVEDEPDPVAYPDTLIRVRLRGEDYSPRFLSLVWDSPRMRSQVERAARTTAGIYKINQEAIRQFVLPQPSLEEQERLAREADLALERIDRMDGALLKAQAMSKGLRRAVLAAAFSGQLNPRQTGRTNGG